MSHSESDQTQPKKDEYFPYGSDYELSPPPKKSLLGLIVENPGPVVGTIKFQNLNRIILIIASRDFGYNDCSRYGYGRNDVW